MADKNRDTLIDLGIPIVGPPVVWLTAGVLIGAASVEGVRWAGGSTPVVTQPLFWWVVHATLTAVAIGGLALLYVQSRAARSELVVQTAGAIDQAARTMVSVVEGLAAERTPQEVSGAENREALERLKESVRALGEQAGADREHLNRLRHEAREAFGRMNEAIAVAAGKSIDEHFDEWKASTLVAALADERARTLQEFQADGATVKALAGAQQTLRRIQEKAEPLVQSLQRWTNSVHLSPELSAIPGLGEVHRDLLAYCERGRRLLAAARQLEAESSLSAVAGDPGSNLRFLDVVSGRSAQVLREGYQRQLANHLQRVTSEAARLSEEWDRMRSDLFPLLDGFHSVHEEVAAAGLDRRRTLGVARGLSEALAAAKFNEILVDVGRTRFNQVEHEPSGMPELNTSLPENTVVRVERRGYTFEGKVVRPARVRLSSSRPS